MLRWRDSWKRCDSTMKRSPSSHGHDCGARPVWHEPVEATGRYLQSDRSAEAALHILFQDLSREFQEQVPPLPGRLEKLDPFPSIRQIASRLWMLVVRL